MIILLCFEAVCYFKGWPLALSTHKNKERGDGDRYCFGSSIWNCCQDASLQLFVGGALPCCSTKVTAKGKSYQTLHLKLALNERKNCKNEVPEA